ncbi:MAG: DUF116 domain-containing protein [Candidatus Hodarchaeales archaeon]|jgi:hypothetical protein
MPFPYEISTESDSTDITNYLRTVLKTQEAFEKNVAPLLKDYFQDYESYMTSVSNHELDINYNNPMIHTQKVEYVLYILSIEYSNQLMKKAFNETPIKVVVLPRCLTGPNFDLLKVKRTKIGWHRIIGCNTSNSSGWKLSELGKRYNFEVFITMGNRFKEPNFLRVFRNLRKKYGHFGLIAVACLPELALGRTYIMEMGIPAQAVPLVFSGCEKWHGPIQSVPTRFPLNYVLQLLKLDIEK